MTISGPPLFFSVYARKANTIFRRRTSAPVTTPPIERTLLSNFDMREATPRASPRTAKFTSIISSSEKIAGVSSLAVATATITIKIERKASLSQWMFIGYEVNQYVEFVRIEEDFVTRARITVKNNNDGTASATWDALQTGLTEKGNEVIDKLPEKDPPEAAPLGKMIDHYLKKGKTINKASLAIGMVASHLKSHIS